MESYLNEEKTMPEPKVEAPPMPPPTEIKPQVIKSEINLSILPDEMPVRKPSVKEKPK